MITSKVENPIAFVKLLWPKVDLCQERKEVIYSVWDNEETVIPTAAGLVEESFIPAFIALTFFLTREPCKVLVTSAKDTSLQVFWGEIRNLINTCNCSLEESRGGPLVIKRHALTRGIMSFMISIVAHSGNASAFQGYFVARTEDDIPRTLFIVDEASGVPSEYYERARTWADRILIIGNPYRC